MPLNCKTCGAPLKGDEEHCPYCGSFIEYEDRPGGHASNQKHGNSRQKNLPQMKYASEALLIVISIFTFGLYGIYWYISRRKSFNELVEGLKFPDIAFAIYIIGWVIFFFVSSENPDSEEFDSISALGYLVVWCGGVWLSFGIKRILKEYLTRHCNDEAILKIVMPSDVNLFIFGYIYLQIQINKMIKAELFAPKL